MACCKFKSYILFVTNKGLTLEKDSAKVFFSQKGGLLNKNVINLVIISGVVIASIVSILTLNRSHDLKEATITKTTVNQAQPSLNKEIKTYKVTKLDVDPEQVIYFDAPVVTETVEISINWLRNLEKKGKDVYFLFGSPGGSIFDGKRLISYIDASSVKVNTVIYTLCASMCAQIYEHGSTRYTLDSGVLMFHQGAIDGIGGSLKELANEFAFLKGETMKLDSWVANRAGIDPKTFDQMVEHEMWITGDTAVDMHLADKLATISFTKDKLPNAASQYLPKGIFSVSKKLEELNIKIKEIHNNNFESLQNAY